MCNCVRTRLPTAAACAQEPVRKPGRAWVVGGGVPHLGRRLLPTNTGRNDFISNMLAGWRWMAVGSEKARIVQYQSGRRQRFRETNRSLLQVPREKCQTKAGEKPSAGSRPKVVWFLFGAVWGTVPKRRLKAALNSRTQVRKKLWLLFGAVGECAKKKP